MLPTHGFGSFCSATQSEATASTIGQEKTSEPGADPGRGARGWPTLLAGLDAYPAYYAHMGPANAAGPGAPDLSAPEPADKAALRRRIEAGEWVVDLRTRTAFAAGHVPGTLNFGLDGQFATYLGWLIPWGTPLTLLGETPEQVAEAQRELVRIGIDRPAAAATGAPQHWTDGPLGTVRTGHVRRPGPGPPPPRRDRPGRASTAEWAQSHIDGAVHIPLHELLGRLDEVPAGEVWVHCARRLPRLDRRVHPRCPRQPGRRRRRLLRRARRSGRAAPGHRGERPGRRRQLRRRRGASSAGARRPGTSATTAAFHRRIILDLDGEPFSCLPLPFPSGC